MNAVERLEKLAEGATPRPWVARKDYPIDVLTDWEDGQRGQLIICEHAGPDAEFIAAIANALPNLLKVARVAKKVDVQRKCGRITFDTGVAEQAFNDLADALDPLLLEEES